MRSVRLPMQLGSARGFTLIELMVVVVIIAVLAVIATPSVARRMRDRRTQQAAYEVSSLYRDARMRALGRGSAMLVRFNGTANTFEVREAVRGTNSTGDAEKCQRLPISSCIVDWNAATDSQQVTLFKPAARQGMQNVKLGLRVGTTAQTTYDVCFTPMGRAYARTAFTSPLGALGAVPVAEVWHENPDDQKTEGLMRRVLILPNGNARLGTATAGP